MQMRTQPVTGPIRRINQMAIGLCAFEKNSLYIIIHAVGGYGGTAENHQKIIKIIIMFIVSIELTPSQK